MMPALIVHNISLYYNKLIFKYPEMKQYRNYMNPFNNKSTPIKK